MTLSELGTGSIFTVDGGQWKVMLIQRDWYALRPWPDQFALGMKTYEWMRGDARIDSVEHRVPLKRKKSRSKNEQDLQDPLKWKGTAK